MCSKCFFKWGGGRKVFLSFNGVMWFVNWYFFWSRSHHQRLLDYSASSPFPSALVKMVLFFGSCFWPSAAESLRIWLNWETPTSFQEVVDYRIYSYRCLPTAHSGADPGHSFKLSLSLSRASCKSLPQRVASWKMSSCVSMYLVTYSSLCLINIRYQLCSKVWYTCNYIWILLIQEIFFHNLLLGLK